MTQNKKIVCSKHGEQNAHSIGDKHYCPKCIQREVLDNRIDNYELETT